MSIRKFAVLSYISEADDGAVTIRMDDAEFTTGMAKPVRLFTTFAASHEEIAQSRFSEEQFAGLGRALVARLAALAKAEKKESP